MGFLTIQSNGGGLMGFVLLTFPSFRRFIEFERLIMVIEVLFAMLLID